MAKAKIEFLCNACGGNHPKWLGKCPDCGAWDSLERFVVEPSTPGAQHAPWDASSSGPSAGGSGGSHAGAAPIESVSDADFSRISSGVAELDRVLGGGFVPGSAILLGGDPGIGKSTLLLQAAAALAREGKRVLYASSEESPQQLKLRATRLSGEGGLAPLGGNLHAMCESSVSRIGEAARRLAPSLVVVDSIQLVSRPDIAAAPGSITQLRRCCLDLVTLAKSTGTVVLIVGHVTKDGAIAGPKLLEHLVDVVLSFEGDRHTALRIVRGVKNRFGSTHEIGIFEMQSEGLVEVESAALGTDASGPRRPGCAMAAAMAGTRGLLAEVQALVAPGLLGAAKRRASGLDTNRLAMLVAVLEKHGGLRLADQDVFVQTVGGMKLTEPALDLAVSLAIAGAFLGRVLAPSTVVIGEVGLTGDVRSVAQLEQRIAEAERRGAECVIVPARAQRAANARTKCEVRSVATVSDAIALLELRSHSREASTVESKESAASTHREKGIRAPQSERS
ncbi:MAG: DNA repair protein RadA [Phycisphaerales bacterium]|nr:DNA repair protein RadA [Phycisphaerales bacterium]